MRKISVFILSLLLAVQADAGTFSLFSPATGVLKGNTSTYVTTAAVSSDITGLFTGTCSATTFLRGDGQCAVAGSGGTPGGSNSQVQYNASGAFGGDSGMTFNPTLKIFTLGTTATAGTIKPPDNGAGAGTSITLKGGDSTSGAGSAVFITGGSRTGATTTAPTAGRVIITGGPGGTTGGRGGLVQLNGGAPATGFNGLGGGININASAGDGSGSGGSVAEAAGNGGTTGAGGFLTYQSGAGNGGGASGDITFIAPPAIGGGTNGRIFFQTNGATQFEIDGSGAWLVQSSAGSAGQPLVTNGTGASPSWGSINLATGVSGNLAVANGGTGVNTLTGPLKGNGASPFTTALAADIVGLFTGCSGVQYLGADGACHNTAGAGTVTSVALSAPAIFSITGSPVTTSGTLGLVAAGTSGGIPYFDSATTLASSAALTANRIILGGGAGAAPVVLGSLGTTSTVLHGNAGGAPAFGVIALASEVGGTLPVANGGTGVTTSTGTGNAVLSASPTLTGTVTATTIAATTVTVGGNSVCQSTGTNCPSASAGGANTQVQYNASGVLAGSAAYTFNSGTGAVSATSFAGSGAALTALDAGNISAGVLPVVHGGTGTTTSTGTGSVVLSVSPTLTGTVTAATVAATTLTGAGSGITNLDAGNVSAGILAVVRGGTGTTTSTGTGNVVLSASPTFTGTITGGTFSGTHTGDGSALTSLNGSNISSGTVAAARVANIDVAATGNGGITGTLPVAHGGTGVTTSTGTGNTVLSASPTLTGTVTAATVAATTVTVGGNNVCQSTGTNCPSGVIPHVAFGSFTVSGACTVVTASSSGISSCTYNGAGNLSIAFTATTGSGGWTCTASSSFNGSALVMRVSGASSTGTNVFSYNSTTGTASDSDFKLTCMGN